MPHPRLTKQQPRSSLGVFKAPTAAESAAYSYDLLVALTGFAESHKQTELVLLLKAAAAEARFLAGQEREKA